jgi:hypothetical protein
MSERVQVLSNKLPYDMLALIAKYDSHPTADLIRSLDICEFPATSGAPARKLVSVKHPTHFCPITREQKRRELHNKNRHLTGHPWVPWMPIFGDPYSWLLSFDQWRFETVPELDYLPDWAREEFGA